MIAKRPDYIRKHALGILVGGMLISAVTVSVCVGVVMSIAGNSPDGAWNTAVGIGAAVGILVFVILAFWEYKNI